MKTGMAIRVKEMKVMPLRKGNEGISLRNLSFIVFVISFSVTAVLLFTTYRAFLSYNSLSKASDRYIEVEEAAFSLMAASDYLTEEAQCYVILGKREHLENYFREAEVTRRREDAIYIVEKDLPDSEPLGALKEAMKESVALMDREYYAMRLVLEAQVDTDIPGALKSVELTPADQALSTEEKMNRARAMMHDTEYYDRKNKIRAEQEECIKELKEISEGRRDEMGDWVHDNLVGMTLLIIMQSLILVISLAIIMRLGVNPLSKAVECINKDTGIPVIGSSEFRYLVVAYNKMFESFKKSIDKLSFKASHDELTNVYNRAGYDIVRQNIDTTTTAMLIIDADEFKQINDNNGHETGDRILQKLSATLKKNFRPDDYIFRIGGDEFVVLMSNVDDRAKRLIEKKIIQINRELSDTGDGLPKISISCGISIGKKRRDPQDMFREADAALYHVKKNGRNGCCFYSKGMVKST
jgi:diguanylate cyclase (GGDEF)-like protein